LATPIFEGSFDGRGVSPVPEYSNAGVPAYDGVADMGVSIVVQSEKVDIDRLIMGELKNGL
jgi:hypothetical protein